MLSRFICVVLSRCSSTSHELGTHFHEWHVHSLSEKPLMRAGNFRTVGMTPPTCCRGVEKCLSIGRVSDALNRKVPRNNNIEGNYVNFFASSSNQLAGGSSFLSNIYEKRTSPVQSSQWNIILPPFQLLWDGLEMCLWMTFWFEWKHTNRTHTFLS